MSNEVLEVEQALSSLPQVVFDCWTSADALRQWHCGTIADVVMDLQVGGEFMVRFQPEPEGDCEHLVVRGRYLQIDAPKRLQYTWKWDGSEMQDSTITIDFLEQGSDATLLKMRHEYLESQKLRDDHEQGWRACLAGVEEYLRKAKVGD